MIRVNQFILFTLLILCLFFIYQIASDILTSLFLNQHTWSAPGKIDFIEYWSAFQLFTTNLNPYDPALMLNIQREYGAAQTPIMMWNPPWNLIVLSPILQLDFQAASKVWLLLNILFLCGSTYLVHLLQNKERQGKFTSLLFFAFLFPPAWNCIYFGQLSLCLTFIATLTIYSLTKRHYIAAGISLFFLTLKPHIFFLFFLVVFWWIVKRRALKVLLSFVATAVISIFVTYIFNPLSLSSWIHTIFHPDSIQGVEKTIEWIGPSIPGAIRGYGSALFHQHTYFVAMLVPLLFIGILATYLVLKEPEIQWERDGIFLIAFSCALAPLSWFFDHSLLLPLFILAISRLRPLSSQKFIIQSLILCLFVFTFYQWRYAIQYQHELFYFGPVVILIYFLNQTLFTAKNDT